MTTIFGADLAGTGDADSASRTGGLGGHEQVVFCQDEPSGLRAIIAIYSTALGPGLGGTRFYPYPDEGAALADVLNLARAMAYKNALAGLDLGGGKAVIIGDPDKIKTEALLRAYGRFVESLNGRYITACDIGTYSEDMDVIARECRFVTGRTVPNGGAGDSSVLTAFGVFQGMRACAEHVWGAASLDGKTVGIEGVGKVGHRLVDHVIADGAKVVIFDTSRAATERVQAQHPAVSVATSRAELIASPLDVFSPCALGGAVDDDTARALNAKVICGGANNQLAETRHGVELEAKGILYAPDYVINGGGVVNVFGELQGWTMERAKRKAQEIYDTLLRVFAIATRDGIPSFEAADRLAEERIRSVAALKRMWIAGDR